MRESLSGGPVPSGPTPFWGTRVLCAIARKGIPMSSRTKAVEQKLFPDHYEQTRIDGKEHPAEWSQRLPDHRFKVAVEAVRGMRQSVRTQAVYGLRGQHEDLYQSTRKDCFFNAASSTAFFAAARCLQANGQRPVARRLSANQPGHLITSCT